MFNSQTQNKYILNFTNFNWRISGKFTKSKMKAGGTYIIVVEMKAGAWKKNPKLTAISYDNPIFAKAAKVIKTKPPFVISEEKSAKRNTELKDFITRCLTMYEKEWKNAHINSHISPDMALPENAMK